MSAGLSRKRLEHMHDVMASHVERGDVPGIVTLLCRGGEVHVHAVGTLAVGGAEPMRRDTIFRIASMTKPVTAAAAMILVEECRLRLDDPLDSLLPELATRRVLRRIDAPLDDTLPAKRPITLRDLLTLRMGLGYLEEPSTDHPIQQAMEEAGIAVGPVPPRLAPDEFMKRLGALPLIDQPGERWRYQTGFDVLNVLLARASGQPLEEFLRERLFEPLGMNDTAFSVPPDEMDRFATCYYADPASGRLATFDDARDGLYARLPVFPHELVSTVDNYLTFARMLRAHGRHGRRRLLSRASVELMTTDQLTPEQKAGSPFVLGQNRGWGFGLSIVTARDETWKTPGRYGWDGGFGTSWATDPREDLIGIAMTQRLFDSPSLPAVHRDFWTTAYQAIDD